MGFISNKRRCEDALVCGPTTSVYREIGVPGRIQPMQLDFKRRFLILI
jgi:hypothetical protein